jgi:uncharacterized membrane protein
VFLSGALAGSLLWLILIRAERNSVHCWLLALAIAAIAAAAILTIRVNFPINDQLMTWSPVAPPDNLRQIWSTWEKAHTIRTILWVSAFVLEVSALSLAPLGKISRTR